MGLFGAATYLRAYHFGLFQSGRTLTGTAQNRKSDATDKIDRPEIQ